MVLRTKDEPEQRQPQRGQSSVMRTRQEQRCQSCWLGVSPSARRDHDLGMECRERRCILENVY